MSKVWGSAILGLIACSNATPRLAAATSPHSEASATTADGPRVEALNLCSVSSDQLLVNAMIPIHYSRSSLGEFDTRELYNWNCSRADRTCKGVQLRLSNVDEGKPIGMLDLNTLIGGEILDETGEVITLRWGPLRTFTVDLASEVVRYVESDGFTEGRGEVRCKVFRAGEP